MKDPFVSPDQGGASEEPGGFWSNRRAKEGRIGWILLWVLGVPIPILLALFLLRGCT